MQLVTQQGGRQVSSTRQSGRHHLVRQLIAPQPPPWPQPVPQLVPHPVPQQLGWQQLGWQQVGWQQLGWQQPEPQVPPAQLGNPQKLVLQQAMVSGVGQRVGLLRGVSVLGMLVPLGPFIGFGQFLCL